jgi:hypothetical protein
MFSLCVPQSTNIMDPGDEVGGIVDALVATLDHESPFCVAAAAGALSRVFDYIEVGEKLIEDSGAIPALLDVVKRKMPPGDLENQPAIFHKYALIPVSQMPPKKQGRFFVKTLLECHTERETDPHPVSTLTTD